MNLQNKYYSSIYFPWRRKDIRTMGVGEGKYVFGIRKFVNMHDFRAIFFLGKLRSEKNPLSIGKSEQIII